MAVHHRCKRTITRHPRAVLYPTTNHSSPQHVVVNPYIIPLAIFWDDLPVIVIVIINIIFTIDEKYMAMYWIAFKDRPSVALMELSTCVPPTTSLRT